MPFGIDPAIEKSSTLPKAFYTDSALYEQSLEKVFAPSWQFIGDSDLIKVPGSVHPFKFLEGSLDEPLVLTRDMQDNTHLVSNVCTHRGMIVCEGHGNERFLRCRYHGRRFGLDGKFQSMPDFEGACGFPTEADNLTAIGFENWGPFLFACLKQSHSFEEFLGPVMKRLAWLPLHEFKLATEFSKDYLVKAHWALYCDNYLEVFHIPFIHASLNQVLDMGTYRYELFEHGNLQITGAKEGESSFDLPKDSPDYGENIAAYYYWLFPNLMLNFYPWGLSINVVKPLGPSTTRVSFIRYVWKPELQTEGAGGDLDRVEREDEAVVEMVQRGLRSRFYDRGRFSPTKEIGTHHFHLLAQRAFEK